jgi:hypothetical protein
MSKEVTEMNRKILLFITLCLALSLAVLVVPVSAKAKGNREIVKGDVDFYTEMLRPAEGTFSVSASEPASANGMIMFACPTFGSQIYQWKLVSVQSVSIDSNSIEIVGYWATYDNGAFINPHLLYLQVYDASWVLKADRYFGDVAGGSVSLCKVK